MSSHNTAWFQIFAKECRICLVKNDPKMIPLSWGSTIMLFSWSLLSWHVINTFITICNIPFDALGSVSWLWMQHTDYWRILQKLTFSELDFNSFEHFPGPFWIELLNYVYINLAQNKWKMYNEKYNFRLK